MTIGVYTAICEEDKQWFNQYLKEIERLDLQFVIHFDKCSEETKELFKNHPNYFGSTEKESGEFSEMDKQKMFNLLQGHFDWGLAWDVDETWEIDAREKLKNIPEADYIDCRWVNLWNDPQHIRTDGPFQGGHRVKLYRLNRKWNFTHPIVNGAKHGSGSEPVEAKWDLTCIHWGMMTKELRELHKARWDRIYTSHVGNNPYGFWAYALDEETYPPRIQEYDHRTYS